eukprot:m.129139 g.129139  ORF g.129139 m.129139 type:complete len:55 (+) comp23623_c0_seq6:265-429(+)
MGRNWEENSDKFGGEVQDRGLVGQATAALPSLQVSSQCLELDIALREQPHPQKL